ncbi:MAG: type II CAAX endopeptidase family protein [Chloroflexota bacterium]
MTALLDPDNHLFKLARSGRRLPHIILAVALAVIFVIISQLAGGIPAMLIVMALSMAELGQPDFNDASQVIAMLIPNTALEQVIILVLAFGPIFLILMLWLALFEKRRFRTLGVELPAAFQKYLRGLVIGLLMFSASVGLSALLGFVSFQTGSPKPQGLAALGGVLFVFIGWMVQGAAEEILTRGWLLPVIGARYSPALGVIVSSVVFAGFHSLNPNLSPIAILNLLLFGLFAALFVLYEGGLWGIFSIHAVWNWTQGNIFGFEVSGVSLAGGTLFDLMETGPDAITGGPFGPEGGLAVTFVLVISCGLVWLAGRRRAEAALEAEPPHFLRLPRSR